MRILLLGIWTHRRINTACLLVVVMGLTAALVGPLYGRSAAEHLLDTRVAQAAPDVTGLSASHVAVTREDLPVGTTRGFRPPPPGDVLAKAEEEVGGAPYDRFWQRPVPWLRDDAPTFDYGEELFATSLYWREGMCRLARVEGRCPSAAGEALVEAAMARSLGLGPGDVLELDARESFLTAELDGDGYRPETERPVRRALTVVGTYSVTSPAARGWYDASLVSGSGDLALAAAAGRPRAPAVLVAPTSMTSQTYYAGVDRLLDGGRVGLDDLDAVYSLLKERQDELVQRGDEVTGTQDLDTLLAEVREERALLSSVTVVALVPLVVLALLLLHALVTGAAELRRSQVALAKLRGHGPWRVWWFGVAEPFGVALAALPVAAALAWVTTRVVNRWWLESDVPVTFDAIAIASLGGVTLAVLVTASAAVTHVIREPLAQSLSGALSRRESGRWSIVARSAVVALAVVTVASATSAGGTGAARVIDLLAPMFLALAVSAGGAALMVVAARSWTRRTHNRGGTASFLAARRLARRRDVARLMTPMVLAVSVTGFAASAWSAADDWRLSRARAQVGAPLAYRTDVEPGVLLAVTRALDPAGRHLAAAVVVDDRRGGMARRVLVDASRLTEVVAWDDGWSEDSLAQIQERLTAPARPPVRFRGSAVSVRVDDVRLDSEERQAVLWLVYRDAQGRRVSLPLGDLLGGRGRGPVTVQGELEGCADDDCVLEQLMLSGSSASETTAQGSFVVARVVVDGKVLDLGLDEKGAWRPARPFPLSPVDPPVSLHAGAGGLRVDVFLRRPPAREGGEEVELAGFARLTPSTTPDVLPVVVTDGVRPAAMAGPSTGLGAGYPGDVVQGVALSGEPAPMRVVARAAALPGVGAEGSLADLESALAEFTPPRGAIGGTRLWAAGDTPRALLDAVRAAGVPLSEPQSLSTAVGDLREDAFMLGWRVFLLIGLGSVVLAVFGLLAASSLQSRWRDYEAASLRTVGVPATVLRRAATREHLVVLGLAAVLGAAVSFASGLLVVPALNLGEGAEHDPPPVVHLDWLPTLAISGAVLLLVTLVVTAAGRRALRRAVPQDLRWADPG